MLLFSYARCCNGVFSGQNMPGILIENSSFYEKEVDIRRITPAVASHKSPS